MFSAFENYANFSGRAARAEYWWMQLWNAIAVAISLTMMLATIGTIANSGEDIATGLSSTSTGTSFFIGIALLAFWILVAFVPNLAVAIRRLHDLGYSGWVYLGYLVVSLVPVMGTIASLILLVMFCRRGTSGDNFYGPDPLYSSRGSGYAFD